MLQILRANSHAFWDMKQLEWWRALGRASNQLRQATMLCHAIRQVLCLWACIQCSRLSQGLRLLPSLYIVQCQTTHSRGHLQLCPSLQMRQAMLMHSAFLHLIIQLIKQYGMLRQQLESLTHVGYSWQGRLVCRHFVESAPCARARRPICAAKSGNTQEQV